MDWIILLPQLPASPSTLRVMVWRRMRETGALGLQNGVWMLPDNAEKRKLTDELVSYLEEHAASCYIFKVSALESALEDEILARISAERDEEYVEFIERCGVLLDDLKKETKQAKFSYAELEEAEADLRKLESWWAKCTQRDFVGGKRRQAALEKLETCQAACASFAEDVYARHGLEEENANDSL